MRARDLMHGFPPPPERQVTLANWRDPPFNRWSLAHVREIVPSAPVTSRRAEAPPLERSPLGLAHLEYATAGGRTLTIEAMLRETCTDAFVVLHRGRIVCERYANGLEPEQPHLLFSVTKSVTGTLAGTLVERGLLDPEAPVARYVPEAAGSAYAEATVRHLLDMTVGVRFVENYEDREGDMIRYRMASGWHPHDGGPAPSDLRGYLVTLPGEGTHGARFHYVSPDADLLGWVLERAANRRYATLLGAWLWGPMGAEHEAYVTVDRLGAARAAGGFCASARDLARFGQLMLERGLACGRQVVPASWAADIFEAGDPDAWARGDFAAELAMIHCYRSQWYRYYGSGALCAIGIHGQLLYLNPAAGVVVAKLSSQPQAVDPALDALTLAACDALATALA